MGTLVCQILTKIFYSKCISISCILVPYRASNIQLIWFPYPLPPFFPIAFNSSTIFFPCSSFSSILCSHYFILVCLYLLCFLCLPISSVVLGFYCDSIWCNSCCLFYNLCTYDSLLITVLMWSNFVFLNIFQNI